MPNRKKDSSPPALKKVVSGRLLIRKTHVQEASEAEAIKIEHALDRLLSEIVRQEQARERKESS